MTATAIAKCLSLDNSQIVDFVKAETRAGNLTRGELYALLEKRAMAARKESESPAQAFAAICTGTRDPVAKSLFAVHGSMRGIDHLPRAAEPAAVAKVDSTAGQLAQIRKLINKNSSEGLVDDSDDPADRPAERLSALVDQHMKANPGCTKSRAYDKVTAAPEGRKLMAAERARSARRG